MIGVVGVEPLLDSPSRDAQHPPARGCLDGLEVQPIAGAGTYEGRDLGENFLVEAVVEAPFLADSAAAPGPASRASHNRSLTSTSSRVSRRKRRYSARCCRVCSTASAGMIRVTVLPPTCRVSDQLGPCPPAGSVAQWQLGLPHLRYRPTSEPGRNHLTLSPPTAAPHNPDVHLSCFDDLQSAR